MTTMLEAALERAAEGFRVFPCGSDKKPIGELVPHGFKDASTDPSTIHSWWSASPSANIGGWRPGCLVVDVDTRNGGDEAWSVIRAEYGINVETLTTRTGGGGLHLWFIKPETLRKIPASICNGIDLKAAGTGYLILPPSLHESGRRYEWVNPEAEIAPLPDALRCLIEARASQNGGAGELTGGDGDIPKGERNDTLFRLAASLRVKGLSEKAILAALLEENQRRCKPPLPEDEVRQIAGSAGKYKPGAQEQRAASALPEISGGAELYDHISEEIRILIPGLLCDGLNALVGRPKSGKSWLCLQVAVGVCGGPPLPGLEFPEHGDVVYLALEECKARTAARLRKIAARGDWLKRLHVVYDLLPLQGGGSDQLRALMLNIRPRLVVIDSLTALVKAAGAKGMDVFRAQYSEADLVRKILLEIRACGLLIHHARKGISPDAVESAASTGGFTAAVDSVILLRRKPEGESTLEVIGREIGENSFALKFGESPFAWSVLGNGGEVALSTERRELLDLLREEGALSPAQVAAELGKARAGVRMMLRRMVQDGLILKKNGKYQCSLHTL